MNNSPPTFRRTKRLAPCQDIALVQHNSLGSWDVFLSLFNSFVGLPPVDVVMLQDPPSRSGFLPSFADFKSFCPPTPRPTVAFYVSLSFLSFYTVLPVGSSSSTDVFHLDVYTPTGCFGTNATKFRLTNVYSRSLPGSTKSVDPSDALPDVAFPCLAAGDFNIYNHAVDPLRVTSALRRKPPHPISTEPPTWLTPSSTLLVSTPDSPSQAPLGLAPLISPSPTPSSARRSVPGMLLPCPLPDQITSPSSSTLRRRLTNPPPPDPCGTKPTRIV